jgi:uncharacterized protein YndB with AHSA1/START domain
MPRTIHIAAFLQAPPGKLFDMYLNPETHAAITGAPVSIGAHAGAEFLAFNGMLRGTILQVIPKRLIVQSWRANKWKTRDLDSTLVLSFWPERQGTRIELVHVNVADYDFADVSHGWETYYWNPWREYIKSARGLRKGKPRSKNILDPA